VPRVGGSLLSAPTKLPLLRFEFTMVRDLAAVERGVRWWLAVVGKTCCRFAMETERHGGCARYSMVDETVVAVCKPAGAVMVMVMQWWPTR